MDHFDLGSIDFTEHQLPEAIWFAGDCKRATTESHAH